MKLVPRGRSFSAVLGVLLGLGANLLPGDMRSVHAQNQVPQKPLVDQVEEEFDDWLIGASADFMNPNQEALLRLATRRKLVSDQYNDPIKVTLQSVIDLNWDEERLERVLEMIPLSTLEPAPLCELVFKCYRICGSDPERQRFQRGFQQVLSQHPDEISRLVLKELDEGGGQEDLLEMMKIIGASSEEQLPFLMQAVKGGDPAFSLKASYALDDLIRQTRRYRGVPTSGSQANTRVDSKFEAYAKRIVLRYDLNKDGHLTEDEWERMLMSPKPADLNNDGKIDVGEYARWMKDRSVSR